MGRFRQGRATRQSGRGSWHGMLVALRDKQLEPGPLIWPLISKAYGAGVTRSRLRDSLSQAVNAVAIDRPHGNVSEPSSGIVAKGLATGAGDVATGV